MVAPGGRWGFGWTPDSKGLMYNRAGELYWVPVEGGDPRSMGIRIAGASFPSLNADGKRLLFEVSEGFNELWVLRHLPLN
jgi:hypothetical protein